MKKLIIIIIGAFTLLFSVNIKGSTLYTLDTPIAELNNHSLSEVFEQGNKHTNRTYFPTTNGLITYQDDNIIIWEKKDTSLNYWYIYADFELPTSKYYARIMVENYHNDYKWRFATKGSLPLFYDVQAVLGKQTISNIETTDFKYIGIFPQHSPIGQRSAKYYKDETFIIDMNDLGISSLTKEQMDYWYSVYKDLLKDMDRVSNLPNTFIDLFNEITDNFVNGIKGFTQLIYLDGYGLTDLGYIVLIVISISVIGVGFYIIRKVIK